MSAFDSSFLIKKIGKHRTHDRTAVQPRPRKANQTIAKATIAATNFNFLFHSKLENIKSLKYYRGDGIRNFIKKLPQ